MGIYIYMHEYYLDPMERNEILSFVSKNGIGGRYMMTKPYRERQIL